MHKLCVCRCSSCSEACGILIPQPGIQPASLALQGGFLTIGPPEKPLRKSLGHLPADGWDHVFLPCWLFGVRCPSTGAYKYWVGSGPSFTIPTRCQPSGEYSWICLPPAFTPSPASLEDPLRPAGRFGPGSCEVTTFVLCPGVHETLYASSKNGSRFPQVLWHFCYQAPLAFKAKCCGGFCSSYQTSQAGEPAKTSVLYSPIGEFL